MKILECRNLQVLVRLSPGRAGVSVDRFVKPLRRCYCVPILFNASGCGVLMLVTRRS